MKYLLILLFGMGVHTVYAQRNPSNQLRDLSSLVNVFMGSSGDHGQMSPAASSPFSMLSIGPHTYPDTHTGYEHNAKVFLGFTHNRFEGVGCRGAGGNLFVRPFLGKTDTNTVLIKAKEAASPGYYSVGFENKMTAEMTVLHNEGRHHYHFPKGDKGFYLDLGFAFNGAFVGENHAIEGNSLSGSISSRTTCGAGVYTIYYYLEFSKPVQWQNKGERQLLALANAGDEDIEIRVSFSSTSVAYAKKGLSSLSFDQLREKSKADWNKHFEHILVKGGEEREKLFYSLMYRTIQSPYQISEPDGTFRATDGSLQKAKGMRYNGWAIWDNYRTQLPLMSVAFPEEFQGMTSSIANMYRAGKKDYATQHEPSPTVRTEHAIVVLLDAMRKGYHFDAEGIIDSLKKEVDHLDFGSPDKALESSYDTWALSEILALTGNKTEAEKYRSKALGYKEYWNKDFKDVHKNDVDRMQARHLYQGTIWQYRWFVPFDLKGLIELTGGEKEYTGQLDYFFKNDLYNHANEPDLQVPMMYNATHQAWKSQKLMHNYAVDTVVQYYFNDNSRGIDPFVNRIYRNEPQTYVRTMDDDAGAMSSWFVLTAAGISPACIGWPVYYLNVPLFESVKFQWGKGKSFEIEVKNFSDKNIYIREVILNGKNIDRTWLNQEEIMAGGKLTVVASDTPVENANVWLTDLSKK